MDEASIPPELDTEIKGLLAQDRTMEAIKRLREVTGWGLAEAKSWIDRKLVLSPPTSPRPNAPLSQETRVRVEALFHGKNVETATALLVEHCGNNLPFLEKCSPKQLERYRFAALKLSAGRLDKLREAVRLAKEDWRDLLVAAGFAHDARAHEKWMPHGHGMDFFCQPP
jgi:hypothetical protein